MPKLQRPVISEELAARIEQHRAECEAQTGIRPTFRQATEALVRKGLAKRAGPAEYTR